MTNIADLERATSVFFDRHWPGEQFSELPPTWLKWEEFLFGSVPNHKFAGCYALFINDDLLYIGLGASRGGGIYKHHGIGRRVMAHVVASDVQRGKKWSRLKDKWAGVTAFYSIALPHSLAYLSASLETFLIRELPTQRNAKV